MSELRLAWAPAGHILQALARDFAADLSGPLAAIADPLPFAVRRAGPEVWFVVGEAELSREDFAERARRVAESAWLIDQSHGRRRLILSGPGAEMRLARGVGLDFRRFGVGASCETQYHTLGLHLTRTAPDGFEILAPLSFAESLYEALAQ